MHYTSPTQDFPIVLYCSATLNRRLLHVVTSSICSSSLSSSSTGTQAAAASHDASNSGTVNGTVLPLPA